RGLEATRTVHCGLVVSAVGFDRVDVPGLVQGAAHGVTHDGGRVIDPADGQPMPGAYAVGWFKRGPSGQLGTNRTCADETVSSFAADELAGRLVARTRDAGALLERDVVDLDGWLAIDRFERPGGRGLAGTPGQGHADGRHGAHCPGRPDGGVTAMTELHRSICRQCINQCAIEVVTSQGKVQEVRGAPDDPVYAGHTCEKGRSQGRLLAHPNRLLTSLKRDRDGHHRPISSEAAMDEIAERLLAIRGEAGAGAIAAYAGTAAFLITAQTAFPMYHALLDAIGTPMRFDPNTIDKGGKSVAASFHGTWRAPSQGFDRPEAILLIGINP
ncbi:MAG: hypothetical protein ABIR34_00830, partial [Marmoricola sp.]